MAYEFKFPDIGEGLTEGEIVEWKVKVGDKVADHQVILEVETDKAVAEVPSPKAGYILSLKGGPGDVINVGEVIAVIGEKDELAGATSEAPKDKKPSKKKEAEPKPAKTAPAPPPRPEPAPKEPVKVKHGSVGVVGELEEAPDEEEEEAAPSAAARPEGPVSRPVVEALPKDRVLARQLGVDITSVRGTGPKGRITEDDVRKAAGMGAPEKGHPEAEGAPGEDAYGKVERIPVRGVRRKVAKAMVDSLIKTAQVTTHDEADVGLLWHIRAKEKDAAEKQGVKLTFLPFIVKAVIGALKRDPLMNSSMTEGDEEGQEIVIKGYYNIGIAVETRDGLIVPNVKDADSKSILELAREIESLAEKARKRTLDVADLKGGTFTITNYGSIGGIYGTPILNYPEVGILGVGRIMDRPVAEDGAIKIRKVLPLSLTFDHRVVDGAKAQHFLNNVIMHLQDPDLIFIGA